MLNWWMTLGLRGKLVFWGVFGLAVNGALFLFNLWMPKLFIFAIAFLLVSVFIKSDDAADI